MYWLKTRIRNVDNLFAEVWSNSDAEASKLASNLMLGVKCLPKVSTEHLKPIQTDRGRDVTSGEKRLTKGVRFPLYSNEEYAHMMVPLLKKIAKDRNIAGCQKMSKEQLIESLTAARKN